MMWPWGHLAVGYLALSLSLDQRFQRSPDDLAVVVLVVVTQLPDLIDKTLAWYLLVLPHGRSLAHSALVASVVIAICWRYAAGRGRPELGVAFGVGYASHLAADAFGPLLSREFADLAFLFWPLLQLPRYTDTPSIGGYFTTLVRELSTGSVEPLLAIEFVLVVLASLCWRAHDFPGLGRCRPARVDRDSDAESLEHDRREET